MFMSEKELSVQIGKIDCIEVDNMDFAKAAKCQVFEKFAANAACAHHKHTSLFNPKLAFIQASSFRHIFIQSDACNDRLHVCQAHRRTVSV